MSPDWGYPCGVPLVRIVVFECLYEGPLVKETARKHLHYLGVSGLGREVQDLGLGCGSVGFKRVVLHRDM